MKIVILFCLVNLVFSKPYSGASRKSRNLFDDLLRNFMPARSTYDQTNCECGLNGLRSGRIVNGTNSDIQPWLATLYSEQSKRQFCSATLINSRYLVTAYHCLLEQSDKTLRILLGTNVISERQMVKPINQYPTIPNITPLINDQSDSENKKRSILELLYRLDENGEKTSLFNLNQLNPFVLNNIQILKPKKLIYNKEFEQSFFKNDIALIELENDVKFTNYIRPICLINQDLYLDKKQSTDSNSIDRRDKGEFDNKDSDMIFEIEEKWLMNKQFNVYGFGRTSYNKAGSTVLQKAVLNYEPLNECKSKWTSMLAFYGTLIDETQLCAFNKYSTICHGDSGGPLILAFNSTTNSINHKNETSNRLKEDMNSIQTKKLKHYLIGVASAGYYCKTDMPSIFTRLSKQLDFIYSNTKSGYWCPK